MRVLYRLGLSLADVRSALHHLSVENATLSAHWRLSNLLHRSLRMLLLVVLCLLAHHLDHLLADRLVSGGRLVLHLILVRLRRVIADLLLLRPSMSHSSMNWARVHATVDQK